MKTTFVRKCICMITALLLVLSVFAVSSSAGESTLNNTIKKIATVDAVDKDSFTDNLLVDYGNPTTINAVQNTDGTYCLCLIMADNSIRILELNADFSVKNTISVTPELSCFAAFCKGEDGTYYVLFNRALTIDTRNQTSMRLVNIGADGKVLRTLDISGMASGSWLGIQQLNCGNNAMAANANYLTAYVGRDMFPVRYNSLTEKYDFVNNGTVHQSSYAFAVDLETFSLVSVGSSNEIPYSSHSFHQIIVKDGNDFVYVDRGDALPVRAHIVTKMSGGLEWKKLYQGNSFEFKSKYADKNITDNETYGQLGGMVRCGDKYMLAGTYQNTTSDTTRSSANVYVQLFDRVTLTPQKEKYLTSYSDVSGGANSINTATNPKIMKVSDSYVAIAYMLTNVENKTEEMHVILTDNAGNMLWDRAVEYSSDNPVLPKYGQVFYDSAKDSIVWFSIVNGKLISNSVEIGTKGEVFTTSTPAVPETTTVTEPTTVLPSAPTTTEVVLTTQPEKTTTPVITTQPQPETTTEQQPVTENQSFWDKIVAFFVGIYNFFVSLFT